MADCLNIFHMGDKLVEIKSSLSSDMDYGVKSFLESLSNKELEKLFQEMERSQKDKTKSLKLSDIKDITGIIGNNSYEDLQNIINSPENENNEELKIVSQLIEQLELSEDEFKKTDVLLIDDQVEDFSGIHIDSKGRTLVVANINSFKNNAETKYDYLIHELIQLRFFKSLEGRPSIKKEIKNLLKINKGEPTASDLFYGLMSYYENNPSKLKQVENILSELKINLPLPIVNYYGANIKSYSFTGGLNVNMFDRFDSDYVELTNNELLKQYKNSGILDSKEIDKHYFREMSTNSKDVIGALLPGDLILVEKNGKSEWQIVRNTFITPFGLNVSLLLGKEDGKFKTSTINIPNWNRRYIKFRKFDRNPLETSLGILEDYVRPTLEEYSKYENFPVSRNNINKALKLGDVITSNDGTNYIVNQIRANMIEGIDINGVYKNILFDNISSVKSPYVSENINLDDYVKLPNPKIWNIGFGDYAVSDGVKYKIFDTDKSKNRLIVIDGGFKKNINLKNADIYKRKPNWSLTQEQQLKEFTNLCIDPLSFVKQLDNRGNSSNPVYNFDFYSADFSSHESNTIKNIKRELREGDFIRVKIGNKMVNIQVVENIPYYNDITGFNGSEYVIVNKSRIRAVGLKRRQGINSVWTNNFRANERMLVSGEEFETIAKNLDVIGWKFRKVQAYRRNQPKYNENIYTVYKQGEDLTLEEGKFFVDWVKTNNNSKRKLDLEIYKNIEGQLWKNYNGYAYRKFSTKNLSNKQKIDMFVKNGLLKLTRYYKTDDGKIAKQYLPTAVISEVVKDPNNPGLYLTFTNHTDYDLNTKNIDDERYKAMRGNTIFIPFTDLESGEVTEIEDSNVFRMNGYYVWHKYSNGVETANQVIKSKIDSDLDNEGISLINVSNSDKKYTRIFADIMERDYQIKTNIISKEKMEEYMLDSSKVGFVANGMIYLRNDSINSETMIHEMMHMFLANLKVQNFPAYKKMMENFEVDESIRSYIEEINRRVSNKEGLRLDITEEVFVEAFSKQLYDKISLIENVDDLSLEELRKAIESSLKIKSTGTLSISDLMTSKLGDIMTHYNTKILSEKSSINKERIKLGNEIELMGYRNYLVQNGFLNEKCS